MAYIATPVEGTPYPIYTLDVDGYEVDDTHPPVQVHFRNGEDAVAIVRECDRVAAAFDGTNPVKESAVT